MLNIEKIKNHRINQKNTSGRSPKINPKMSQQLTKDTVSFSGNPIKVTEANLTMYMPALAKNALKDIAEGVDKIPFVLNLNAVRNGNKAKVADFMLEETGIKLTEVCKMSDKKKLKLLKQNVSKTAQFLNVDKIAQFLNIIKP